MRQPEPLQIAAIKHRKEGLKLNLLNFIKGASAAILLSLPMLAGAPDAASAGEWRHCAGEDRTCTLSSNGLLGGEHVVRYSNGLVRARFGTGSSYTEGRSLPTPFFCGINTFGTDPLWGSRKHCQVRVYSFVHCAWEGERCNLNGQAFRVRYGTAPEGRNYVELPKENAFFCDNSEFGQDPAPGQRKRCWAYRP